MDLGTDELESYFDRVNYGGVREPSLDVLRALHALQAEHIAAEESDLIPRLGASARWSARVYLAEHTKLAAMTEEWRARLARLPAHIVEPERRLALLDASLPLQHLLEHHFEREEKGLFVEIAG